MDIMSVLPLQCMEPINKLLCPQVNVLCIQEAQANICPGDKSLCAPCFLQAYSEAPGVWFAGLTSIAAVAALSEMYPGNTTKALHSGNLG